MKEILTIDKPQEYFDEIDKLIDTVFNGFMALAMDYGYHIKNTFGAEGDERNPIYELRDNIHYRLRSSKLHFYLQLKRKMDIEHRFGQMLKENPRVFDGFMMGNPHFEFAADEVMAVYDSVIFHLSSAFDYLAMLIQFVFGKNPQTQLQWITLVKHCYANNSDFCRRIFKEYVRSSDRDFVSKFNDYRAELIHRKKSTSFAAVTWKVQSGKVETRFECSDKIKASFKKILDKEKKYCITYVTYLLIKQSVLQIANVLEGVMEEFKENYDPHAPVMNPTGFQIGMVNTTSKYIESPSGSYWAGFMKYKSAK